MNELKKAFSKSLLISCYVLTSIVLYNRLGIKYALGSILLIWIINILDLFLNKEYKQTVENKVFGFLFMIFALFFILRGVYYVLL